MTRCDCCDLPVESCGRAAEQRQRAEQRSELERLRARGYFAATFHGVCEGCGEHYSAGTLIVRTHPYGYRAECCA